MKRIFLYLLTLLAALSLGCTKNGLNPERDSSFDNAPWAIDESMPVPIQFDGSRFGVTQTKAGKIESLTGVNFGVLGLDPSKASEWGNTDGPEALLLLNKKATIRTNKVGDSKFDPDIDDDAVIVKFLDNNDQEVTYYYPVYSRFNYTFYGYHTTAEENGTEPALTKDGDAYYVANIPVGERDILWAKAEATDFELSGTTYKGFNSKYIRNARKENATTPGFYAAHLPQFEFAHKTAHLHFNVRAEDAYSAGTFKVGDVEKLKVKSIKLTATDLPTKARLNVLDGTLSATETAATGITLSATPYCPTDYSEEGVEFGEGLFIVPGYYAMKLTLTLEEPNWDETATLDLPIPTHGDEAYGFKPGIEYTYTITIKSLETQTIGVALTGWSGYTGDFTIPQPVIE